MLTNNHRQEPHIRRALLYVTEPIPRKTYLTFQHTKEIKSIKDKLRKSRKGGDFKTAGAES
jgi:hypothetical protein